MEALGSFIKLHFKGFFGGGLEQYFFGFGVPTCSKEVPDGSSESPIDDNLDWFGGKPFFTHAAAAEG